MPNKFQEFDAGLRQLQAINGSLLNSIQEQLTTIQQSLSSLEQRVADLEEIVDGLQ